MARVSGEGEVRRTRSVKNAAKAVDNDVTTAGSRDSDGDGIAPEPLIEQLFSQPACLRSGHIPEALQQHEARAGEVNIAIDGSISAARTNAVRSRCTGRIVDS